MDRASFITHKGVEIYYVDYKDIKKNEEFHEAIDGTNEFREKLEKIGKKDMLMLVDISGSFVYGEVLDRLKQSSKSTAALLKKSAIVGVTGSKKILLNIVNLFSNLNTRAFNTAEEAKDWLIK